VTAPALKGLVLAGGRSERMGRDKALLEYGGETQLARAARLVAAATGHAATVSVRGAQAADPARGNFPVVVDVDGVMGPIAGILAAQRSDPGAAWLVVACDLPLLDAGTLGTLVGRRDPAAIATAFRAAGSGLPEPLCAIYEPSSHAPLRDFAAAGRDCPRKFLLVHGGTLLDPPHPEALDNVNTPEEAERVRARLAAGPALAVQVQYFALLREQAGRGAERVETTARTARDLYAELARRHGFTLSSESLKVAINAEFAEWDRPLSAGDAVVFIPPVAGG
jgi:molybdenum cofactor guanylyltransferase